MIKVTGFFTTKDNGQFYKDPAIHLIPHLSFAGRTTLDVQIHVDGVQVGAAGFEDVPITLFDNATGNAYSAMIAALEVYVIEEMQPRNLECTFEIVSPV